MGSPSTAQPPLPAEPGSPSTAPAPQPATAATAPDNLAAAAADIGPIRYRLEAGMQFGYAMTIDVKSADVAESHHGILLYEVDSVVGDYIQLKVSGRLQLTGRTGPAGRPMMPELSLDGIPRTMTIGHRGNVIKSDDLTALHYAMGDFESHVFGEFSELAQATWQVEKRVVISSDSWGARMGLEPGTTEHLDFSVISIQPQSVRVAKKYSLDAQRSFRSPSVNIAGNGEFVFNRDRGCIESQTMHFDFKERGQFGGESSAEITLTSRLLTPDVLAMEMQRLQTAIRLAKEFPTDPLDVKRPEYGGMSRKQLILAELAETDRGKLREVLEGLGTASMGNGSAEIAKAIAAHLQTADRTIRQSAAKALLLWGTRDVEAELVAATKDSDSLTAKISQEALERIRGLAAAPATNAAQPRADEEMASSSSEDNDRIWRDKSGKFEVWAAFLGVEGKVVRLKMEDGLIIKVLLASLCDEDRRFAERQAARQAAPAPSVPTLPADGKPVDLLALIDPVRDEVSGEWKKQGKDLIAPRNLASSLTVPGKVPTAYKLTVVAERILGKDALNIGLVVGGRQTMLVLDGWGATTSRLTSSYNNHSTRDAAFHTPVFKSGESSTIECRIRDSSVKVICNGELVIEWQGNADALQFDRDLWENLPEGQLFLGSWDSSFRISKLDLQVLDD